MLNLYWSISNLSVYNLCDTYPAVLGEAERQSYSQDLRERVLRALARGEAPTAIARRYEVSRVYVYQVRQREQETGVRTSFPIGGHRRSRLAAMESELRDWIAAEPGLTLAELQERLAQQGVSVKVGALWHQLNRWNLTFKKNSARQRARARGRAGSAAPMECARDVRDGWVGRRARDGRFVPDGDHDRDGARDQRFRIV